MKNISHVSDIVKLVLEKNPKARNSDQELYAWVCLKINPNIVGADFIYSMCHLKELGLPKPETVRRARQKLQEKFPDLRATEAVTDKRFENWKAVREYVKD